jgi:hypothetical protein
MVARARLTKTGKAARERMGVAPERYARADRNVLPRGLVSIELDAPEQVCNRSGESPHRLLFRIVPSRIIVA